MSANFVPTLGGLVSGEPFRFWCQKVLPLVYDDSLSYYELLNKVVQYLNNVISDIDTLADDVTALHDAYDLLEQYVNEYFDNLDVQAEVNTKLDEMAENGFFDDIITPLFNTYTASVDAEISDMQDYITTTVSAQNNAIDVLEGRMDTFASLTDGSTTADAELLDIRVEADGTVAATAGDAVRKQVTDLKSALNSLYNTDYYGDALPFPFRWENGTFSNAGENNNNGNTRYARTDYLIPHNSQEAIISMSNVSTMWYGRWNVSDGTFVDRTMLPPAPSIKLSVSSAYKYRFAIDVGNGNTVDLNNINSVFAVYFPLKMDTTRANIESVYSLFDWPDNLFNPNTVTKGKLINKQGAIVDSANAWYSDRIIASPGYYVVNINMRIRLEDEDGNLIRTYNEDTLNTAPRTFYVDRFCYIRIGGVAFDSIWTSMIQKGTTQPSSYVYYTEPHLKLAALDGRVKSISCIGDSMTAGTGGNGTSYPSVLQTELTDNQCEYTVEQYGGGGENCNTIISRFGATPIHAANITLPADTSRTEITFLANGDDTFNFNRYFRGVNPVVVDGIECTLTKDSDADTTIYIQRTEAGSETYTFTRNPQLITYATREKLMNDIVICWMGTNNPAYTAEQIIEKQKVLYNTVRTDKVLFIGLTKTGTSGETVAEQNTAMLMAWGNKFLDIRDYILSYGIADAEITPTEEDTAAIAAGNMPPSLLSDDTHFNADGYTVIGKRVYRKLVELNWI